LLGVQVRRWTGVETRALRNALRLSVRVFAGQLGVAVRTVSKWEAGGRAVQLRPDTQSILDTALARADENIQTRFAWLLQTIDGNIGHSQRVPAADTVIELADAELLHIARLGRLAAPVLGALSTKMDRVRQRLDRSLASQSVSSDQLDRLEEAVARHADDCVRHPPIEMLCKLTLDITGVQSLLAAAHQPEKMHRLYRVSGGLSVLLADELMVLGDTYAARAWYGTARTAAGYTRDQTLQAMVLTLAAMLPLYWGDPRQAVTLTRQATRVTDGKGMAAVMAPRVEALALSQIGDQDASQTVLTTARQLFDQSSDEQRADSVFGFSERRFRFYEARTLSRLGKHQQADDVFDQALALYPSHTSGDPTLIGLERAAGLVRRGNLQHGIDLARATLTTLPTDCRADIFLKAGHKVLTAVPPTERATRAIGEYSELLRHMTPLPITEPFDPDR
jgi:transcriptional regulator with XRE-family HTH domain